jgi:hypothetical protein
MLKCPERQGDAGLPEAARGAGPAPEDLKLAKLILGLMG